MRRLKEAGIKVFLILGNHDAENKFISRLELSENVRVLSFKSAESIELDELGVVVHGRSFPQRDVKDNLAAEYPAPAKGRFNIGLLHTACGGRPGHENYAPCSVDQLIQKGYDYWALGHVHAREELNREPWIVFPGNLQGRHVRETGPKGATLIEVTDGKVVTVEAFALDVVRWADETIDLSAARELQDVIRLVRERLDAAYTNAEGRSLAIRIRLQGETALHHLVITSQPKLAEEIETVTATIADDIWIEKVTFDTRPVSTSAPLDPTVAGRMAAALDDISKDGLVEKAIEAALLDLGGKFPNGAHRDAVFATIRAESASNAERIARSLIEQSQGTADEV
jgi:DNA repair exonuclease SbcCD nuclease subunit